MDDKADGRRLEDSRPDLRIVTTLEQDTRSWISYSPTSTKLPTWLNFSHSLTPTSKLYDLNRPGVDLYRYSKNSDNWATVTLAFFLRYPNPFAAHVLSCDVIDRSFTLEGSLRTTRLILKRGNLPKWLPAGVVARSESWIIEESEVDSFGRRVVCTTRNLEHTKALRVIEQVTLRPLEDG